MDAINGLSAGARRAEAAFDAAAQQLASAGLPMQPAADRNPSLGGDPSVAPPTVDVADQLVAMTVAADVHHATTAAMRSALSMYRDSLDLLRS